MRLMRRGHTLLELLVSLVVGAMVIALGATIGFRHQRFHRDVVVAVERADVLDEVVSLMPISLRGIAPGEGDIAPGGARDTSLEFRATIATAVVCDSSGVVALMAPLDSVLRLSSVLSRPAAGDSAWFLVVDMGGDRWMPRAIVASSDSMAVCRIGGTATFGSAARTAIALRLSSGAPPGASVVRITRPWRYSIYRAADGWFFGAKDWNGVTARFNTIQPVAGPLVSASQGGLRFRYLDSMGAAITPLPADPSRIAAIEIGFRVDSQVPGKYVHASTIRGSASVVIALRNRAR
jgi:prepilin-type N-terminal cleavage/methylation domain-containing protein